MFYNDGHYTENSFKVAVLGTFITEKTTLINALAGYEVMVRATLPLPFIPIEVHYGEKKRALLEFKSIIPKGWEKYATTSVVDHIRRYQTGQVPPMEFDVNDISSIFCEPNYEIMSPSECPFKSLKVFCPSSFLKEGFVLEEICLTDYSFRLQSFQEYFDKADVIIFLMNATGVFTQFESDIIEYNLVPEYIGKVLFVVNRCDLLSKKDFTRLEVYLHKKLMNYKRPVFYVSSINGIKAQLEHDKEKYNASGIEKLRATLMNLSRQKTGKDTYNSKPSTLRNSDTYMWESVRKISNLDIHIDFVNGLIDKYSWDNEEEKELRRHLKLIKDKQNDDCVNISIIGEFSSGKSSFINALLRDEILVSSALQGTTVVNSVLQYSPEYYVKNVMNSGKSQMFKSQNKEAIKHKISDLSTNAKLGRHISYLEIGVPSKFLRDYKIRIIDTPGTNSLESWHEETTRRAIRDLSDMSIILTDATKMLPETLMNFMDENLADVFEQCAICATKIDYVPSNEREGIITYAKKRIFREFGISDMLVLPFSAPAILGEISGENIVGPEQKAMAELSEQNALKFLKHTTRSRQLAQIKKLLSLVGDTFTILEDDIKKKRQERSGDLAILEKSRQAPLEPFINKQKRELTRKFELADRDLKDQLAAVLRAKKVNVKVELTTLIRNAPIKILDNLKKYMSEDFVGECEERGLKLAKNANTFYISQDKIFYKVMKEFQEAFRRQFTRLGILEVDIDTKEITVPPQVSVTIDDVKTSVDYVSKELDRENGHLAVGFWGGMVVGFAAGNIVGAVIGAIVGGIMGSSSRSKIEKVRNNVIDNIDQPLDAVFDKIINDTMDAYDKRGKELLCSISREIDRYLKAYRAEINRRIMENNKTRTKLEQEIAIVSRDLALIGAHRQQLENSKKIFNRKKS